MQGCNVSHKYTAGPGELRDMYNDRVTSVRVCKRSVNSSGGNSKIPHAGVLLTTASGYKLYVRESFRFLGW